MNWLLQIHSTLPVAHAMGVLSARFPGALRQQGLALNAPAATVVVLVALTAPTLGWFLGIDPAAVLGLNPGFMRKRRRSVLIPCNEGHFALDAPSG
jgi:hypothetical protein